MALAGPAERPAVVDRRRIELMAAGFPRQVYHAAGSMPPADAEKLLQRATVATEAAAESALRDVIADLATRGQQVVACGVILGNLFPASTVAGLLASHAGKHAAEGQMFRRALIRAAEACGLPVTAVAARDLSSRAAAALRMSPDELLCRVRELGLELGPPWAQDQKDAALVAWLALAGATPPA